MRVPGLCWRASRGVEETQTRALKLPVCPTGVWRFESHLRHRLRTGDRCTRRSRMEGCASWRRSRSTDDPRLLRCGSESPSKLRDRSAPRNWRRPTRSCGSAGGEGRGAGRLRWGLIPSPMRTRLLDRLLINAGGDRGRAPAFRARSGHRVSDSAGSYEVGGTRRGGRKPWNQADGARGRSRSPGIWAEAGGATGRAGHSCRSVTCRRARCGADPRRMPG